MNKLNNTKTVFEYWLKPPKIVKYSNSLLLSKSVDSLVCEFFFPEKYYNNGFFINNNKILSSGDMFRGKRFFWIDRPYSLLEFYSDKNALTGYYFDLSLPAKIIDNSVIILDIKLDFFILPNKKDYILLDEDELDDAIEKKLFSQDELLICNQTKDFIIRMIENNNFDSIFTDYQKTNSDDWERYSKYNLDTPQLLL